MTEAKPQHPARATYDLKTQSSQDAFLAAYSGCGTIAAAAKAAGLSCFPVYEWRKEDAFGFVERFASAQQQFGDKLEGIALKRVEDPTGKGGSDLLLIAMLNANKPDKWRRGDAPTSGGATAPVTQIVINLAPGVEMPVIEGQAREIEDATDL